MVEVLHVDRAPPPTPYLHLRVIQPLPQHQPRKTLPAIDCLWRRDCNDHVALHRCASDYPCRCARRLAKIDAAGQLYSLLRHPPHHIHRHGYPNEETSRGSPGAKEQVNWPTIFCLQSILVRSQICHTLQLHRIRFPMSTDCFTYIHRSSIRATNKILTGLPTFQRAGHRAITSSSSGQSPCHYPSQSHAYLGS